LPVPPGENRKSPHNPTTNLWHCFGCGKGGDNIAWVMEAEGVSFRHALEIRVPSADLLEKGKFA